MTGSGEQINKGFILKARKIEDSAIAHAPPHIREVWDLILRKVNFKDQKCGDTIIRRGQWLTRVPEIQELLHWTVGARKERYKAHQIETAMKFLRTQGMVTTSKTAGGMFITVVNYDTYQNPGNYESRTENRDESRAKAEPQYKKEKNVRRSGGTFVPPTPAEVEDYAKTIGYHRPNLGRDFCQYYEATGWRLKNGRSMSNWKLGVQTWRQQDERNPGRAAGAVRPEDKVAPLHRDDAGLTPRQRVLLGGAV